MTKTLPCIVRYDGVPVGIVELEFRGEDELGRGQLVTSSPRHPAVSRVRALCLAWPDRLHPESARTRAHALFEQLQEIWSHFSLADHLRNPLPAAVEHMLALPLAAGVKMTARFSDARALVPANVVTRPHVAGATA